MRRVIVLWSRIGGKFKVYCYDREHRASVTIEILTGAELWRTIS
jgi:hypothetical protein